jgi:plastocyanin
MNGDFKPPRRAGGAWALAAVAALAAGIAARGAQAQQPPEPPEPSEPPPTAVLVTMTATMKFVPAKIVIRPGQVVVWKNASRLEIHTVAADPALVHNPRDVHLPKDAKPFYSGDVKPGETYWHKFSVPGYYRYVCKYHERADMHGEILVQPYPE